MVGRGLLLQVRRSTKKLMYTMGAVQRHAKRIKKADRYRRPYFRYFEGEVLLVVVVVLGAFLCVGVVPKLLLMLKMALFGGLTEWNDDMFIWEGKDDILKCLMCQVYNCA